MCALVFSFAFFELPFVPLPIFKEEIYGYQSTLLRLRLQSVPMRRAHRILQGRTRTDGTARLARTYGTHGACGERRGFDRSHWPYRCNGSNGGNRFYGRHRRDRPHRHRHYGAYRPDRRYGTARRAGASRGPRRSRRNGNDGGNRSYRTYGRDRRYG